MSSSPPDGFEARPLVQADAPDAAELLYAYDSTYLPEVTDLLTEQDVLDWWRRHELTRDSIAVRDDGLAAFALLDERKEGALELQGFVHPDRAGLGLEGMLLDWGEARGEPGSPFRTDILPADELTRSLVEQRGYRPVRHGYRMVIDLDESPQAPEWPDSFSVDTLRAGDERTLYEVIEEAFADEWGRPQRSFEDWKRSVFSADSFDPTLCFLVRAGEAVAAEICQQRFGIGFIGSVGVLEPWRRRGLGRALLLHGFGELYRRGERRIGLGVDAENPTGATKLYESVGMRVAWQADTYEKVL